MKIVTYLTLISAICGVAFAGEDLYKKAETWKETLVAASVMAGGYYSYYIEGLWPGKLIIAADNEDGSRSCWMKVLDSTDIKSVEDFEKYKRLGLPVDVLLKHANLSIYPPGHRYKYVVRNRLGKSFHMRQTQNEDDYELYHVEDIPKMITEE